VEPTAPEGREVGIRQLFENIASIFSPSSNQGLSGTVAFRLAWWSEIIEYTAFGPYFWDGKGFGINLANADGFQPTADESLRAPHNSHLTVLARMGVPGFALWWALQGTFAISLIGAIRTFRRRHQRMLSSAAAWLLVYWTAMMVDTSFDPYLEGPQGGIWFWSVFGVGLVLIQSARRAGR
jgi:O-antigen ligase